MIYAMGTILLSGISAFAADFGWMADFNIKAEQDMADFRARLAVRFKTGMGQIDMAFSSVNKPADVYMIFRLGEMSSRTPEYVINMYKSGKHQGWGALAKSLGIKPGSREFHELKKGSDMDPGTRTYSSRGGKKKKDKGHGKKKD